MELIKLSGLFEIVDKLLKLFRRGTGFDLVDEFLELLGIDLILDLVDKRLDIVKAEILDVLAYQSISLLIVALLLFTVSVQFFHQISDVAVQYLIYKRSYLFG